MPFLFLLGAHGRKKNEISIFYCSLSINHYFGGQLTICNPVIESIACVMLEF